MYIVLLYMVVFLLILILYKLQHKCQLINTHISSPKNTRLETIIIYKLYTCCPVLQTVVSAEAGRTDSRFSA